MLRFTRILPTKVGHGLFINRPLKLTGDGIHPRFHSEQKHDGKSGNSFEQMVDQRYYQAKRSIIVQVLSQESHKSLYAYCARFGKIISSHFYTVSSIKKSDTNTNYILLEFEHAASAASALDSSNVRETDQSERGPPIKSRFLWLSNQGDKKLKQKSPCPELITRQVAEVDKKELNASLQTAVSVSAQMEILYQKTHLNESAVRLRFMAALQIEELFSGIYWDARVYPFGSSVNGFGKLGSDLDMILKKWKNDRKELDPQGNGQLYFHEKEAMHGGPEAKRTEISTLAQVLTVFAPGVEKVIPIPKARIPIVKYYQSLLGLHVDVCLSNMSGFYMSELLYVFGEIDERVRPLIFTVRHWARQSGLTSNSTSPRITNFPLTCLVLCFLQQLSQPILPTLSELERMTRLEDIRMTANINCTFLRDLSQIEFSTENTTCLEELLIEFLHFVAIFDFEKHALSLHSGRLMRKQTFSAMYIENPLERELNVCKMVSRTELDRIQEVARLSLMELLHNSAPSSSTNRPWGILKFTLDT